LRVVSSLSGKGTVAGAVVNDGVVTGGLSVAGDYTQSAKGELVLGASPLKVSGAVRLAGDLDLAAAGTRPARTVTVLDHQGGARTTGAFKGLKEGTRLKLADTTYRITYRGGDGNDVVLTTAGASAAARVRSATTPTAQAAAPRATDTAEGFGWWPYVLALGLLGGLAVTPALRTRGRRGAGGRHAAGR
ncbi:autotransporter, partial [Streptomyces griseorubiginosus]